MVQGAPTPSPSAPNSDDSSSPSRLLSKHRPRRRAAPRFPLPHPPPPPPPPVRSQPDLTLCHCCGVRFPLPQQGATKLKRRPVRPLSSLWRIVLLCAECLSLVRSAAVCSYCLSLDNLPPEDSAVFCRRCKRCVHQSCIPAHHRTALIQPVDVEDFLCVDCCPTLRSKNGGSNLGLNLEAYARDSTALAGGNPLRKAVEVKSVNRSKDVNPSSGDPALLDEELALQLHLAMNGSQRISRSGNTSGGGSIKRGKGKKGVVGGTKVDGDQEICVTNMMAQLDDEVELGCRRVSKRSRRFDRSVPVVLALECVKAKRKIPPVIQDGLVDRFKNKYSKRSSSKQAEVEKTKREAMPDRMGMDGDNGTAPAK